MGAYAHYCYVYELEYGWIRQVVKDRAKILRQKRAIAARGGRL